MLYIACIRYIQTMDAWKWWKYGPPWQESHFPCHREKTLVCHSLTSTSQRTRKWISFCPIFMADDCLLGPTGWCLYRIANEPSKRAVLEQWIGTDLEKLMAGPFFDFELKWPDCHMADVPCLGDFIGVLRRDKNPSLIVKWWVHNNDLEMRVMAFGVKMEFIWMIWYIRDSWMILVSLTFFKKHIRYSIESFNNSFKK